MIKNYFKIAYRNITKRKAFSTINILGLGLGFACSILILLFIHYHLQFDNFHTNTERIYRIVTEQHEDEISYSASVPPGFAEAFRTQFSSVEKVGKIVTWGEILIRTNENDQVQKYNENISFVEPSFFEILNFPLVDGTQPDLSKINTAVISEKLANKIFKNESPINKTIQVENKDPILITGIFQNLPENTVIQTDLFISYPSIKAYDEFLGGDFWGGINSSLQCFALLHPNQDINQLETSLIPLGQKHRGDHKNVHQYKLQALADIHFNPNYYGGINAQLLWIFSIIGFFLLIMACINFINISTAQSVYRSREIGIRKVLGGQRSQLFWQFLAETFVISTIGLLIGIIICMVALPYFNTAFDLVLSASTLLNYKFILFGLGLLIGISFLAGSYPGLLLAGIHPLLALKRKVTHHDSGGYLLRKFLVTSQFVISMILIIGAIVINKQVKYAINSDLGFASTAIVMTDIPTDALTFSQMNRIKEQMSASVDVEKITACFASPGAGDHGWHTVVKYDNRQEAEEFAISAKIADEDYVNTFDLNLVAGRNVIAADTSNEVIVNEMFATKLGLSSPDELINKSIGLSGDFIDGRIVGVVENFHDESFGEKINPIFISPRTDFYREFAISINMKNIKGAIGHIESIWNQSFPEFEFRYTFLDERIAEQYESETRILLLAKVFSALAVLIGCLGIYGLIIFFVAQKNREIGIRKVLGGTVSQILILLTKDFLKVIVIAGFLAIPIAWYFSNKWLENYQYRTDIEWWIFGIAIGGVLCLTLFTLSYHAIKAAFANPINSLRTE